MRSMRINLPMFRSILVGLLALVPGLLLSNTPAHAVSPDVVISQVYGGGGTLYTHDFIELHNRGSSPVNVATWSVQYSAPGSAIWTGTVLTGVIPPGGYLLVRGAAGAGGGAPLPTPDVLGGSISIDAVGGKVVLRNKANLLSSVPPVDASGIVDLLGYGAVNYFEGAPAAALTASTAAFRGNLGCVDTDNNASDFASGAPAPRNAASAAYQCEFTLDVSALGNGSVGKSPDQATYGNGTLVQLTATADPGWHFVEWGDDASGSTNPLSVTMDANKSITATFEINTYTLTVTPVGNGSVAKVPDQSTYDHGTEVQLTATADPGWTFVGWSGDATGSTNPLSVTMDDNKNITATFTINTYTLTVTPVGNGSVAKAPDQSTYNHGTEVQLTATADPGWTFVGWSGDATGSTNPLPVTMDADKNITATFTINTYTLTVTPVGNGSVAKAPDQSTYNHGTEVQLTATADPGWHFVGWSGDATGSTNPLSVTMLADRSITATFAINTYTLTVTPVGNGSVAKAPDQSTYNHGTEVQLTATPDPGWHFVGWSGDATGSANPRSVTMDVNKSITATFAEKKVVVSQVYGGSGQTGATLKNDYVELFNRGDYAVDITGWTVQYAAATSSVWTAMPLSGVIQPHSYFLVKQAGAVSGTPLPTPDAVGSIDLDGLSGKVALVSSLTALTGTCPPTDPVIEDLLGYGAANCSETSPAPELTNLLAEFRDFGGCIDTDDNSADFAPGTPAPRNSASPANSCTFTLTVLIDPPGTGTVSRSPDQANYPAGSQVDLTALAAPGFHFDHWSGAATGSCNPLTVTMTGDLTITAHFVTNTAAGQLVISQFFGGGGESEEWYLHDFVELYNRGNAPVNATGWTIQFAPATSTVWNTTPLSGVIEPGRYYLVRLFKGGELGLPLPAPDAIGALDIDPAEGKLALVSNGNPLTGACPSGVGLKDLVGYGGADCSETAPAASSSNTEASFRGNAGCLESNNNQADFANGSPAPRNSATEAHYCKIWLAVGPTPTQLALSLPMPNPSRGRFNFSLGLPVEGLVRVTVSDVQGRRIASLVNGNMPAGQHTLSWNGTGDAGPVRSGLYYLTLENMGRRVVQRFVIVR